MPVIDTRLHYRPNQTPRLLVQQRTTLQYIPHARQPHEGGKSSRKRCGDAAPSLPGGCATLQTSTSYVGLGTHGGGLDDGIDHYLAGHIFRGETLFSGLLLDLFPCILLVFANAKRKFESRATTVLARQA